MKNTNLHPSVVSKLRENVPGPGGLHHFDLSNTQGIFHFYSRINYILIILLYH